MSASPDAGVVDADHRAWGVPNLFVCDGSVMPTQGSANPALTIMALASRLAARMASGVAMDDDRAARAGTAAEAVRQGDAVRPVSTQGRR